LRVTEDEVSALATAFPQARPETREALARVANVRALVAGDFIAYQGEVESLALVIRGHIAVRRQIIDGREVILRIARPGELAVLQALVSRPVSADAVAISDGRIAGWQGSIVRALVLEDAAFGLDLMGHVLHTFEAVAERADGLLYQGAVGRVARALRSYQDLVFDDGVLTLSQLPSLVGTSREMTSRVLRQLRADGVVARHGRDRLRLLDPARLQVLASSDRTTHPSRRSMEQVPRRRRATG
jgi:CRP/FNR family transcriptional regulator